MLWCLEPEQVMSLRASHRCRTDGHVEGDKPATVLDGERQQVDVRQLPRTVHSGVVDKLIIEEADTIRPELVRMVSRRGAKAIHHLEHGMRIWVSGMRHDAHAAVLRDGARCPATAGVVAEPCTGAAM